MRTCVNCGEQLPAKAKFCLNCGMAVESEKEPVLSRSEMYKNRELNIEDEKIESSTEPVQSRTGAKSKSRIMEQIMNFGTWIKNNPLTSFMVIVVTILIFLWMNKMMGIILLVLAIICGYFYMLKVGSDSQMADTKLKRASSRVRMAVENILTKDDKKPRGTETQPFEKTVPEEENVQAEQVSNPKPVTKKRKRTIGNKMTIVAAIILIVSTYFGAFSAAVVTGFGTPTTLLSILRALGQEKMLIGILIGPVVILLGALIKTKFIIKVGSIINIGMYGYVFYLIYQNEAATSGWMNMVKNIHFGISGYLVVIISVLLLFGGVKQRNKKEEL